MYPQDKKSNKASPGRSWLGAAETGEGRYRVKYWYSPRQIRTDPNASPERGGTLSVSEGGRGSVARVCILPPAAAFRNEKPEPLSQGYALPAPLSGEPLACTNSPGILRVCSASRMNYGAIAAGNCLFWIRCAEHHPHPPLRQHLPPGGKSEIFPSGHTFTHIHSYSDFLKFPQLFYNLWNLSVENRPQKENTENFGQIFALSGRLLSTPTLLSTKKLHRAFTSCGVFLEQGRGAVDWCGWLWNAFSPGNFRYFSSFPLYFHFLHILSPVIHKSYPQLWKQLWIKLLFSRGMLSFVSVMQKSRRERSSAGFSEIGYLLLK